MPEANLSSLEHWSCEPPEQTVFFVFCVTDGHAEVKAGRDAGWQSKTPLWEQDGHDECHSLDIWTKVYVPPFLNLVGLGVFLKFFSQGVQWEPLCPAGGTNQSSAVCDSRERVSDIFNLATGVSWIYLSCVFAFHICMHTSHAYTYSHALAWFFYSFVRSKRSSCLITPGVLYLPQTPTANVCVFALPPFHFCFSYKLYVLELFLSWIRTCSIGWLCTWFFSSHLELVSD